MRRGAYFEPQATVYSGRHTGARGVGTGRTILVLSTGLLV